MPDIHFTAKTTSNDGNEDAMNLEVVNDYYGKVLKTSDDLKTSACCEGSGMPAHLETLLANVHEEVRAKYYGCGIVVPAALEGARVLDLGSGSGRDVYLIAQLVGTEGEVVGIDMTDGQLAVAQSHIDWLMRAFGYPRPQRAVSQGLYRKARRAGARGTSDRQISLTDPNARSMARGGRGSPSMAWTPDVL